MGTQEGKLCIAVLLTNGLIENAFVFVTNVFQFAFYLRLEPKWIAQVDQ
jgi:hypothetical protein